MRGVAMTSASEKPAMKGHEDCFYELFQDRTRHKLNRLYVLIVFLQGGIICLKKLLL